MSVRYDFVPLLLREPFVDVVACDVLVYQSEHESGIEVVASPDGTHHLRLCRGIFFPECLVCPYNDGVGSSGTDKFLKSKAVSLLGYIELEFNRKINLLVK